jgi:hypothetical protein
VSNRFENTRVGSCAETTGGLANKIPLESFKSKTLYSRAVTLPFLRIMQFLSPSTFSEKL